MTLKLLVYERYVNKMMYKILCEKRQINNIILKKSQPAKEQQKKQLLLTRKLSFFISNIKILPHVVGLVSSWTFLVQNR